MPVLLTCLGWCAADDLPTVTLRADDTWIEQSCRVRVPPGLVITDANRDGVLHVAASDIVIEFEPQATLRGADPNAPPDSSDGYGIRVAGQRNVTIRGGRISGFRAAIWATDAPDLTIENIDASDARCQHLASDPEVEADGDWLYPHHNDEQEWLKNYGAAIYVERSDRLTVRNCRVWYSQNALCLDRVNEARIYDNDFSFNSGWGVALWRSCRNTISRNALDFCIRGYSHNVYNRGQDSASLLMFEQCSDNVIAENSATHGGDGLFGWAGQEAMNRSAQATSAPTSRPCGDDRNLIIGNDFSYAAAHGLEMTFSFDNGILNNRLVGNAICGIWAGYSQGTLIAENEIAGNGGAGYGLERGGINIDSGRQNRIVHNKFSRNACGVHLWWKAKQDPALAAWTAANLPDCQGNLIADNEFRGDELAYHFRGPGRVTLGPNTLRDVRRTMDADQETTVVQDEDGAIEMPPRPDFRVLGQTHPVGARRELAGRENILMTEWGPWDHASPLVWPLTTTGGRHVFSLRQFGERPDCAVEGITDWRLTGSGPDYTLTLSAAEQGVHPYRLAVRSREFSQELRGALLVAPWRVASFRFAGDPVAQLDAWRTAASGPDVSTMSVDRLDDPALLGQPPSLQQSTGGGTQMWSFRAQTQLPLKPGNWRVVAVADGGLRVIIAGRNAIEAWEPQRGTRQLAGTCQCDTGTIEVVVEHFAVRRPTSVMLRLLPTD